MLAIKNINISNFLVCLVFLLAYDLQDLGCRALWDNWRTELYKFYCIIILTSQNLGEESVSSSAEFKCLYISSVLKKCYQYKVFSGSPNPRDFKTTTAKIKKDMQLTFSKGTLKCTWKKNTKFQGSKCKKSKVNWTKMLSSCNEGFKITMGKQS